MLQHAVNAILYSDFGVASLDMNVAGSTFKRGENYGLDKFNDRTASGVSCEPITRNGLFGVFFGLGDLQCESFGRLFENALRLFRAFKQIANLFCCCDTGSKLFAEEQGQFVAQKH